MRDKVRNRGLIPNVGKEGFFTKPIIVATTDKYGSTTFDRLYSHHTLASIRKLCFFYQPRAPKDQLDFILTAEYNHSSEFMPERVDVLLQAETKDCPTWRRLRNSTEVTPPVVVPMGHPIQYGGVTERRSPHSVKLMNSGVHSSQTNPGYTRQPAGGAIFFY